MFDPPESVPWSKLTLADNDTPAHRQLALEAARQSIVLLKNEGNLLPLRSSVKSIAVVGPNADSLPVLLGNYNGTPSAYTTILDGIRKRFRGARITPATGSPLTETSAIPIPASAFLPNLQGSLQYGNIVPCKGAAIPGLSAEFFSNTTLSGPPAATRIDTSVNFEWNNVSPAPGVPRESYSVRWCGNLVPPVDGDYRLGVHTDGGSRLFLDCKNIVVNWSQEHAAAILEAWYPGEEGGTAVADVLSGEYNPAGRLPVTFYKSVAQLPPFTSYSMNGRTYRYLTEQPLYPFGYGLSFSSFHYSDGKITPDQVASGTAVTASARVTNASSVAGDEVVELYLSHPGVDGAPIRALAGFRRMHLAASASQTVSFTLHDRDLSLVDDNGVRRVVPGPVEVWIGGGQPVSGPGQPPTEGVSAKFTISSAAALDE